MVLRSTMPDYENSSEHDVFAVQHLNHLWLFNIGSVCSPLRMSTLTMVSQERQISPYRSKTRPRDRVREGMALSLLQWLQQTRPRDRVAEKTRMPSV